MAKRRGATLLSGDVIKRYVTHTRKDSDGDITHICNPEQSWSPKPVAKAIEEIDSGNYRYFVQWSKIERTEIHVVNSQEGSYLRTDRDEATENNLDNLPEC